MSGKKSVDGNVFNPVGIHLTIPVDDWLNLAFDLLVQ